MNSRVIVVVVVVRLTTVDFVERYINYETYEKDRHFRKA